MLSTNRFSMIRAVTRCSMMAVLSASAALSGCGGGGGGGGTTTPPPATYTIGGSVSGLTGSGLVLQNNGANNLTVTAKATTFQFSTTVSANAAYSVTVLTQPTSPSQTCTVSQGSGTAASNVSSVSITCTGNSYTVGGTIAGLTAGGLVLQNNHGDNLTVAANAKSFSFSTPVASGAAYSVSVLTQPSSPAETCTVAGASGTVASSNVGSVAITCKANTLKLGGTITGLTGSGLVLQNNGADNLTVAANATSFTFSAAVASGAAYSVSVLTQPANPAETCTIARGTGTVGASNITSVSITCKPNAFSVGGTISGLTGAGLVLQDNGGNNLTVSANATTFAFPTAVLPGTAYSVTVATQPGAPAENCQVANGVGTVVNANVASIAISCYTFGRFLYVANSTDSLNANGDVAAFGINADGTLTAIGTPVTADLAPSAIVVDPTGEFVYVSNRKSADVSVYAVDPIAGGLTLVKQVPDKGVFNTAIAISPSGQYLFTGGSTSNTAPLPTSELFAFTRDLNLGTLTADPNAPYGTSDIPFGIAVDPTNQFLFVTAQQKHEIHSFSIGTVATTLLTETANSPFNTPSQPYGAVVSPLGTASGGFVFVSDAGFNKVSIFSYDDAGNMTELTGKPWYSPVSSGLQPEGLAIDATGTCLYVANYADGSVSSLSISANGVLTGVQTGNGAVSTGNRNGLPNPGPIDVKVDPAAPFVYVVNSLDGSVSAFSTTGNSPSAPCTLTLLKTYLTGPAATGMALTID